MCELQNMAKLHQQELLSLLRKYSILACTLSFLLPFSMGAISGITVMKDFDRHKVMYEKVYFFRNMSGQPEALIFAVSSFVQVFSMLHCFVFPALVMTFLSLIYSTYASILKRRLLDVREKLLRDLTRQVLSETLDILTTARQIHGEIENSVSFLAFLAYVLTFVHILNLVCIYANDFLASMKILRCIYSINIFLWTLIWFVMLTLCGSKINSIARLLKSLAQDIVSVQGIGHRQKRNKELLYLLLLNDGSKFNLRFTGWSMFYVDKKLFLSTSGVLVTYGVLFAKGLRS
ncbi:hypothetical protein HNY73_009431 [Argiope bruennichi]|uniref:Gustatory receptor n=1 Tax=Argiope bruennichi TaxID=94029 RepID=A0A8T0F9H7_ARGBR|nr:hypothetical protein HNY73_009431 [Argiope bruennichi]